MIEMVGRRERDGGQRRAKEVDENRILLASRAELLEARALTLTLVDFGCSSGVLRGVPFYVSSSCTCRKKTQFMLQTKILKYLNNAMCN